MRIGLYHGYELTGSGSNEYTRYLAKNLAELGHQVHIICREPAPEKLPFVTRAYKRDKNGEEKLLFNREKTDLSCTVHLLPHGEIRPVYITDKQRPGNVKPFSALTDAELKAYHNLNETLVRGILKKYPVDLLHANHLIYQPVDALKACESTNTPLIIYPHGSSIEYTIKQDGRYKKSALRGILGAAGLIIGNLEVRDRIIHLYSEQKDIILDKSLIVGVGVDTALFKPVEKQNRKQSIERLTDTGKRGGKIPNLSEELFTRLEKGDTDAVRDYWNSYDHSLPDNDLNDHLERILWNGKILLFVGALTAGKGLQSLLTALPFILARNPETHLVIVGAGAYREVLEGLVFAIKSGNEALLHEFYEKGMDLDRSSQTGPWEDVKYFLNTGDNLNRLLKNGKALDRHVHFLGRLDHSLLQYLFPCADLAVFPSVVPEAYPLVLMEALSNGVIPLVSYFSGFKDGVDELEPLLGSGMTAKMKLSVELAGRIESIINNISSLLDDPGLTRHTTELRNYAVKHYDWKIRAKQMVKAYKKIIEQDSRAFRSE